MPELCKALVEPFMSANTILALNISPPFSWPRLNVTFLLDTSSFSIVSAGALKSRLCFAPLKLPEATNFKPSTKNSCCSGLASTSPLATISMPVPPSKSPTIWLSKPFTLKCLVFGSTKKLPFKLILAAVSGLLAVSVKSVFKSTGSASAMCPDFILSLVMLYFASAASSV